MQKRKQKLLKLSEDDLMLLRALRDDIDANSKKIDTMEHWFSRVVKSYGVDLDHEEWSLNLDTGILERINGPVQTTRKQ